MFLSQDDIIRLSQTEEGRKEVDHYLTLGRISYGISQISSYLGIEKKLLTRPLTQEELQECAGILDYALKSAPHAVIMKYLESMKEEEHCCRTWH